ncbi:acetyltransferase (GNAT) family protein [Stella humosa]|uniref:Acetyltransferase (GNAT) family protein n=1 Tax=Stella humosa TaxID=94 RepID=A0A3N1KYV6_9PROT|nr:GNAT family N-acetyltransferase [Stella humosa]ROP84602.1 acetyltransferase (GNAT) family protein [Stella humosa]BBK34122.1 hypothetical protein STHU_47560 [Stella humosa]
MTALVLRSKAHWGYPGTFLTHFAPSMVVRPTTLVRDDCWVAAGGRRLLAYGARRRGWLDDLFVAPGAMGLGLGRVLLEQLRARARAAGHRHLMLNADPFAAGFYRRQGARLVGWTGSPWPGEPGRRLPRMRLSTRLALPRGRAAGR